MCFGIVERRCDWRTHNIRLLAWLGLVVPGCCAYHVYMAMKRFNLFVEESERAAWESAARGEGRSLAAWLRWVANRAAGGEWSGYVGREDVVVPQEVPARVVVAVPPVIQESQSSVASRPVLCVDCQRKGSPACAECRKAAGWRP